MAMAYDFYQQYPGPLGPHLNCLSDYTKTRKEEDRMRGVSIHVLRYGSSSAQAPRKRGDKAKAIAGLTYHCSRHPNDKQSEVHLSALANPKARTMARTWITDARHEADNISDALTEMMVLDGVAGDAADVRRKARTERAILSIEELARAFGYRLEAIDSPRRALSITDMMGFVCDDVRASQPIGESAI